MEFVCCYGGACCFITLYDVKSFQDQGIYCKDQFVCFFSSFNMKHSFKKNTAKKGGAVYLRMYVGMHGKGHSTLGHGMTTVLLGCVLVVGDLWLQHIWLYFP